VGGEGRGLVEGGEWAGEWGRDGGRGVRRGWTYSFVLGVGWRGWR